MPADSTYSTMALVPISMRLRRLARRAHADVINRICHAGKIVQARVLVSVAAHARRLSVIRRLVGVIRIGIVIEIVVLGV